MTIIISSNDIRVEELHLDIGSKIHKFVVFTIRLGIQIMQLKYRNRVLTIHLQYNR